MKLTIAYNKAKKGIEFFFIPKVTEGALFDKLIGLGFKQSFSVDGKWYVEDCPSFNSYLKELQTALEKDIDPMSVGIQPSYEPDASRIDHYQFSYVTVFYKKDEQVVSANYVLFDSYLKVATDIAERFGKITYGEDYVGVEVAPRKEKRKSRTAFDEGRIIGNTLSTSESKPAAELIDNVIEKEGVLEKEVSYKNEHGVYTKETAGDRYEQLEIPFSKGIKYSATIHLVYDEADQFRYGLSEQHSIGGHSGSSSPISEQSPTFATRIQAIEAALQELLKIMEREKTYVSTKEKGASKHINRFEKAINTVLYFGIENGILLNTSKPENELQEASNVALEETEANKATTYTLGQGWTTLDDKTVEKFAEFINTNLELMEWTQLSDQNDQDESAVPSRAVLLSDKDRIGFQILNTIELHIDSYTHLEENVNYMGSTISTGKLKKAIQYMITHPETLQQEKETKEIVPPSDTKAIPLASPEFPKPLPYVQIPEGIVAPFDSGALLIKDDQWLHDTFTELWQLDRETLFDASAKQLFMLSQMAHPNNYGIEIFRSEVLREWEKRGEGLFRELDYPVALDYPYVNIHTGYSSVHTLEKELGDNRKQWWAVAEHYRPIADLKAATIYIEEHLEILSQQQEEYINLKTGKPKSGTASKDAYRDIEWQMKSYQRSLATINTYTHNEAEVTQEEVANEGIVVSEDSLKPYLFFTPEGAEKIRKAFREKRLPVPFIGAKAWEQNITPSELTDRWNTTWDAFEQRYQDPLQLEIDTTVKEITGLKGKRTKAANTEKKAILERQMTLKKELAFIGGLVHDEFLVFQDELFLVLVAQAKASGYDLPEVAMEDFKEELLPQLLEDRQIEQYANEPIQLVVPKLLRYYFEDAALPATKTPFAEDERVTPDYIVKTIAIMHDHYMEAHRLTKKQVENLMEETGAPNKGMLWEAVELSWLLWYRMYYKERVLFENRLGAMIRFWDNVQPTYAYSDSSKELYKQYSTPCPIGAMVAQYTQMDTATSIFEPSAGNGLLLVGAAPEKTHVNEIDRTRRQSLMQQQFKTITHWNAAEPFPEELTKSFDVVVTNPPFAKWEDSKFDKTQIIHKYFDKHRGLEHHIRLEHMMAGLALHTMKDNGKAAIIIMGHIYHREEDGYIVKYRPFFNWLYRHYRVADVINMNSYKIYNKQGAVKETMLILIDGRKPKPSGAAPKFKDAPHLGTIVDDFTQLWQRVKSNIKTPLENLVQQLKIAHGYDIF